MSSEVTVAFILVAAAIAVACFIALSRRAGRTEEEPGPPFECGTPPKEAYPRRVAVSYFLTAIIFVVILTALVLLIVWARDLIQTPEQALLDSLLGGAVLATLTAAGFAYAWRIGAFKWEK
jgi:NADH-quinone oxidoreductase subunit A